jgi:DNA-binding FadR family transcriptional regulator
MDVALSVTKAPAEQVADAYKALEDKVAQAKRDIAAGVKEELPTVGMKLTPEGVEQALQLRALLKAKGLGYAVSSMTEAERTAARKLLRDALAFYVSGGKL